jgi:hypothetical protein
LMSLVFRRRRLQNYRAHGGARRRNPTESNQKCSKKLTL